MIERGVCDFQVKIDLAKAAGYTSVIVFNRTGEDGCETLVNMLAVTDIPAIFVSRTDGFRILGQSLAGYTCDSTAAATGTPTPAPGPAQPVNISAVFDGWGYTHMYKATPNSAKKLHRGRLLRAAGEPGPDARRGLRRPERPRGGDRSGREPRLRLALRARHARPQVHEPRASRRSARSSSAAAPTTGASRSTSWAARSTSWAPTAIAACGSSSTSRATSATASRQPKRRTTGCRGRTYLVYILGMFASGSPS